MEAGFAGSCVVRGLRACCEPLVRERYGCAEVGVWMVAWVLRVLFGGFCGSFFTGVEGKVHMLRY